MDQKPMTKKQKERYERLLPVVDGIRQPRYIRCYDNINTKEPTSDRFTIVFTGNYKTNNGWHMYIAASAHPAHPQGICMHEESEGCIDRPKYGHLGKKITFAQLPKELQDIVMRDYLDVWNLPKCD